jgi:pimeloyl-ACP methyl ester carboxylesterase
LRDVTAIDTLFTTLLGSGCIIRTSFPDDVLNIGFAVAWNDRQVVVVVEGTRNWTQFLFHVLGTTLPAVPTAIGRINIEMFEFANDVQNRLRDLNPPLDLPRVYAGHSLGGVVCQYLLAIRQAFDPERVQHCITFGAPKGGDQNFANKIAPYLSEVRTELDPVPFLPINFSEFLFLHVPVPLALRLVWDLYVKPTQGYSITAIGDIAPDALAVGAFSDIVAISHAIITGVYRSEPNGHFIATYASYLAHAASRLPAIPECAIDLEVIEMIDERFPDINPATAVFRATTMNVYRTGTAPPAAPAIADVPILIYANFLIRGEAGEGDAAVGHFTHTIITEDTSLDIRDDYNEGTRGANYDRLWIPDNAGTSLVVRFVEIIADPETAALKYRIYADRHVPTPWPTDV